MFYPIMLNVIMLNVIMLNVIMLNVIMLNAIMLNVIMLNIGPTLRPNYPATRGTHKKKMTLAMDTLKLIGLNLGQVFNSRCGCVSMLISKYSSSKQPKLKLKTRSKTSFRLSPVSFRTPRTGLFL
jgi:hypothetical protein